MSIDVRYAPTCTWRLDGTTFWCTHDEVEIVEYVYNRMSYDGPIEIEEEGYACVECGEPLEGIPKADRADLDAEMQLMSLLEK